MTHVDKPLRVAAVGAGHGATAHFEAARLTDAIQITGIFDLSGERARAQAHTYGIGQCYESLDQLLDDPGIDCVAILTPPDTHEPLVLAALAAGHHVVCEKPLGRTTQECDRMIDAARAAGKVLLPVHNRLYSHAITRAHEIIASGTLGSVFLAQASGVESPSTVDAAPWLRTDQSLGGVLIAQATHPLYILRSIMGEVDSVSAMLGPKIIEMSSEDTAGLLVSFSSGALASLTATFGATRAAGDHSITLYGTKGMLATTLRGGDMSRPERVYATFGKGEPSEQELPDSQGWITGFQHMWQDYARAILQQTPAKVTAQDAREVVRIVRAAYTSIARRTTAVLSQGG